MVPSCMAVPRRSVYKCCTDAAQAFCIPTHMYGRHILPLQQATRIALLRCTATSAAGGTPPRIHPTSNHRRSITCLSPLQPSVMTFNMVIKAYSRVGNAPQVRSIMGKMRLSGFTPDEVSYGCLVEGYAQAGQPDLARQALDEMHAAGVPVDAVPYTSLLHAYGEVGEAGGCAWLRRAIAAV